jgi:tRNA dimethylallyltransferase
MPLSKNLSRKSIKKPSNNKQKIVVVLGPTASGKSDLAVKIAKKWNGEIISADSRQVYKGLDMGSGKVPRDKIINYKLKIIDYKKPFLYKGIVHHLLDVANPKRIFTAANYQKLAERALNKIISHGKLPIVCGGTGFYIDSLIYDMKFPEVPPQPKIRKNLEKKSTEELWRQLETLDPERAKSIDKYNRHRLIRSLEIVISTKSPVPKLEKESPYDVLKIGIKIPEKIQQRLVKNRLEKRLKEEMVKEVENLHKKGLSWKRLDELGLEYRYISRYLQEIISYDEMKEEIYKETLRYIKRQMTWFKKDQTIKWISPNNKKWIGIIAKYCK